MSELDGFDLELLRGKNYAHFVTLRADGSPQPTVVWVDADPERGQVLVNTAIGRVKDRNVRRDPRVGISVRDQGDPRRYVAIGGIVVDLVTGEEADRHIDFLSRKYDGEPWTSVPGQRRVLYRIRPDRILRHED